ncbi:MAG: glucosyltransferase domain-containing protein [Oscillospiraceae bacterium]|nr:glucosyltransferase domain-containing protein [Oscillospiraceae bacterium]
MPEKTLEKLKKTIQPEWKACFFAALLVGFLAHFYKLTNHLPNWDGLVFRYDPQNMLGLGRWFLSVVCAPSSFYDLPFLNGIIAIVFHALGAVCICEVLGVREKTTAGLIGAVVVSFSTVTSVLMYNYVADGYSIAFFLACLAALYLTKEKPKYWLGVVLIALTTGIYQAYVTVTIMLILLKMIDKTIYGNVSFGKILKKCAWILASGILGMALYAVVLKLLLAVSSTELLEYQGINDSAALAGLDLFAALYVVKETFLSCFFDASNGPNVYVILNLIVLAVTVGYYLKYTVRNKVYKHPANIAVALLLVVLLFFGAGALAFVNASVDYHNLMRMGYVVFYLLFLLIYERGQEHTETHTAIKRWIVLVLALVIVANQVVIANVSYHKAHMAYEKSYGVLVRIADRIEQTPGADTCDRLLVVGALEDSEAYSVNLPPEITGITDGYLIRADDETVGQSVFCSALNDYCGKQYVFVSGQEKQAMLETAEVFSMGIWPANGCVAVVEDTVVVKLGAEGEHQ